MARVYFKELATFKANGAIDYAAIDAAHSPQITPLFYNTTILDEAGTLYIVGEYTGLLTLGAYTPPDPVIVKKVGMGVLGELLPTAVLLEIEDYKMDTLEVAAKRRAATQILMYIYADRSLDIYGNTFITIMTQMTTHTSLTGVQAVAISDMLKSDSY